MSISILILTLNEAVNIEAALDSVTQFDDIVVLDSFSTDNTVELAEKKGARVYQREFDSYAKQRNYGLNDIQYKNDWVLMLDADERLTPEIEQEMISKLQHCEPDVTLFRMRRKDMFYGKWIKRSSAYPTWFGRLVKPGHITVQRDINEEYVTEGRTENLDHHLLHFPFNKGMEWWFARHNRYSSMEALEKINGLSPVTRSTWLNLFSRDPVSRRKSLKTIVYALPCKPLIIFIGLYFIRGGCLDGGPGLRFCLLKAIYEYLIDCKVDEMKRRQAGLPI